MLRRLLFWAVEKVPFTEEHEKEEPNDSTASTTTSLTQHYLNRQRTRQEIWTPKKKDACPVKVDGA